MRTLSKLQPWALALLRIALGASMAYHGYEKLIPAGGLHRASPLAGFDSYAHFITTLHLGAWRLPAWLAYVSLLTELLGGLFLILGLLTRLAALFVAGNMIVALVALNLHHGYFGSEYTLSLITMALLLITTGSGALALDRHFGNS